jgi:hypothetical protein
MMFGQFESIYDLPNRYADEINELYYFPEYNLKIDLANNLYLDDTIIYSQSTDFKFYTYFILNKKYIIVTELDSLDLSLSKVDLPINKINVIDLSDTKTIYFANIMGGIPVNIQNDSILIKYVYNNISSFKMSPLLNMSKPIPH